MCFSILSYLLILTYFFFRITAIFTFFIEFYYFESAKKAFIGKLCEKSCY